MWFSEVKKQKIPNHSLPLNRANVTRKKPIPADNPNSTKNLDANPAELPPTAIQKESNLTTAPKEDDVHQLPKEDAGPNPSL